MCGNDVAQDCVRYRGAAPYNFLNLPDVEKVVSSDSAQLDCSGQPVVERSGTTGDQRESAADPGGIKALTARPTLLRCLASMPGFCVHLPQQTGGIIPLRCRLRDEKPPTWATMHPQSTRVCPLLSTDSVVND